MLISNRIVKSSYFHVNALKHNGARVNKYPTGMTYIILKEPLLVLRDYVTYPPSVIVRTSVRTRRDGDYVDAALTPLECIGDLSLRAVRLSPDKDYTRKKLYA